ncbi:DNA adenine methylase [Sphingobium sp. SA2]|uniref:DNA adenine methylase n=1 Tax=Sphingobium sp. SA2 TaxID=1524832 RepID=UPI0028C34079|nr:DNA adenine methylase [Sphingobium sp. SA2]MDT7533721.1 DNA adenine methylase [Sphingobium sp. SA2]
MKNIETLSPIAPVRPVAGYIGGKRALAKLLVPMIGAMPHDCYVEPFVGMGGVFFRRDSRPKAEVINDISADVTNLFRLLQRHYQQLLDVLKWQIASRAEFERLVRVDPDTLTDLERAARFLFIQRLTFGGKVMGRSFGTGTTSGARFDLTKLVPMLEDVHERLCGVTIERLSYDRLIPRYDRPHTLFYLDPPYFGCTNDYGRDVFSEGDFTLLSDLLKALKGRFILSINDVPQIREMFAWASIEPVELNYRVSGKVTAARELVITGH